MINRAPSRAIPDSIFCGASTIPVDNSLSMLARISADGGTVRLTAWASLIFCQELTEPDFRSDRTRRAFTPVLSLPDKRHGSAKPD